MKTKCQICEKEFPSEQEAYAHEYDAHIALPHDSEPEPTPSDKPPSVPSNRLFAIRRIEDGAFMSIVAEGVEEWVFPTLWDDPSLVLEKGQEVVCIANNGVDARQAQQPHERSEVRP